MKKKILIFENQVYMIENTFKTINLLNFNEELEIKYLQTYQEMENIRILEEYDLIIIDIDLSVNSKKDGIGIIKEINSYDSNILEKVFVLTGSTKVRQKLDSLDFRNIPVVKKPTDIDEITIVMKNILKYKVK